MFGNDDLMILLEIPDDYMVVFFKLSGFSEDTMVACLIEEMEGLRDFYFKHKTLSVRESDTIIALLRR